MVERVIRIAKEKKPFDKTIFPLLIAFVILVGLIAALVFTITRKPKDKPVTNDSNTMKVEEKVVNNNTTSCSSEEIKSLSEKAKNIKAQYKEIDNYLFYERENANAGDENGNLPVEPVYGYALEMVLYDGDSDFTLMISNDLDDEVKAADFTDGSFVWDEGDTRFLRTYTVSVYANTETCQKVLVREFDFTIPKWNEMSKLPLCSDPVIANEDECKHFTMVDKSFNKSYDDFNTKYDKLKKEEKKKQEEEKGISGYLNKYLIYIIIGAIVLVAGVVVAIVFIVRKGRSKNEEV